jgi:hypothetical protein
MREVQMARSTLAASALILIAGAGTAATNGNGNASLPATRLASVVRAGHPNYVIGGWVCPPGFAWRNAGRQDWLCVEPAEARRVAWENQSAAENWVRVPDGSYGCRPGMVMRDAFKDDRVCVDPARRELVEKMNLALFDAR